MRFLSRLGLQKRLMIYVAAWLVVISLVYMAVSLRAITQSTAAVFQERLALAQLIAGQLDSLLTHRIAELEQASAIVAPALAASDFGAVAASLENLCRHWRDDHHFTLSCRLSLVDPQGNELQVRPLAGWAEPSDWPHLSSLLSSHFQNLDQVEMPLVTYHLSQVRPLAGKAGPGDIVGFITVAVQPDDHPIAYLSAEIDLSAAVGRLAPDLNITETGYMIELVDQEGKVLVSPESGRQGALSVHSSLFADQLQARRAEAQIHTLPGSASHLLAYAPLKVVPWGVFVEQQESLALRLPHLLQTQLLLFGLFALTVGLATAWLITHRAIGPVRELTAAAQRIARGELDRPIVVQRQDEIGELAAAFEQMRQNLAAERRRLQELAILEERDRLAREMHDGFAQALGVLNLNAKAARQALANGDLARSAQALDALDDLIDQAYADVREAISSLRTTVSHKKGLVAVAGQYLEEFGLQYGLETQLTVMGSDDLNSELGTRNSELGTLWFTTSQEIQLMRIIQEALSNVRKHARASQVRLSFNRLEEAVEITIADNGLGFNPKAPQEAKQAFGLVIMRERVESLGGVFRLESQPGAGATVVVRIPLAKEGSDPHGSDAYFAGG